MTMEFLEFLLMLIGLSTLGSRPPDLKGFVRGCQLRNVNFVKMVEFHDFDSGRVL